MRLIVLIEAAIFSAAALCAQDAREIVRKSVELDQANWLRMKDYTWVARNTERHLDSQGQHEIGGDRSLGDSWFSMANRIAASSSATESR